MKPGSTAKRSRLRGIPEALRHSQHYMKLSGCGWCLDLVAFTCRPKHHWQQGSRVELQELQKEPMFTATTCSSGIIPHLEGFSKD